MEKRRAKDKIRKGKSKEERKGERSKRRNKEKKKIWRMKRGNDCRPFSKKNKKKTRCMGR